MGLYKERARRGLGLTGGLCGDRIPHVVGMVGLGVNRCGLDGVTRGEVEPRPPRRPVQ